jgi:hypothetical protein
MSSVQCAGQKAIIITMIVHYLRSILEWVCQTLYLQEEHGVRFVKHMGMIPIITPDAEASDSTKEYIL